MAHCLAFDCPIPVRTVRQEAGAKAEAKAEAKAKATATVAERAASVRNFGALEPSLPRNVVNVLKRFSSESGRSQCHYGVL